MLGVGGMDSDEEMGLDSAHEQMKRAGNKLVAKKTKKKVVAQLGGQPKKNNFM